MSVKDKNKVLKIILMFFCMSVLIGKGVTVYAEEFQYAYNDVASYGDVTLKVEWNEPELGQPTTFHVSASGGSGLYKFNMEAPSYSNPEENSYESVADPSRGEWTEYTDECDSHDYTFTMTASGIYNFRFHVMDLVSGVTYLRTNTYIQVNDANYPSVNDVINSAVKQCNGKGNNSEYEKALWLHDWLLEQLEYDNSLKWSSAESALTRGLGTCQSYESAYSKLLSAIGIENSEVRDTYDGHTWNAVKLDGEWYQVDCTWDDSNENWYDFDQRHLYFGLTDELMALAHPGHAKIYNDMNYGTRSTNLKNNYFVRSGDAAKWIETYRDRIETKLNSKETKFVVDADNANYPPSISGIQNGIIAYAINQTEWSHDNTKTQLTAIGNATGFEFETTYEEQNNVSITGWQYIGGKWYYYEELGMKHPGVMAKDCVMTIGDSEYLFDANGCMLTGWQKRPEGWYYTDSSGRIKKGWQYISGFWYFLQINGVMAQEWLCLDNTWYYTGTDGAMRTGWQYVGGAWYFLQSNGVMAQNWLYQNGTWYYMGVDGAMKTGWQLVGDTWYFLQSSGAMARNWIYLNGTWYYLGADGAMQIDWQYVGGAWYYLEQDGHMAIGWKKINNVWYYLNGSGQMVTGTHRINGSNYYFNQSGAMAEMELSDLIADALKPVGNTLYVWGGGWNVPDNGSGETALRMGVWPEWEQYFQKNKQNYSYRPGRTDWENGHRESRFWGVDCSGYLGWLVYNSVQNGKDNNGYVGDATKLAKSLAGYGFGTVSTCTPNSKFYPGDIVSINGHCYLSLGQCQDGSVLLLHSTPNGGVQMSGTVNGSSSSQASRLAQSFMQQYYPDWWTYFGKEGRQVVNAKVYLYGTKLTWQNAGAVYDSQGLQWKSADQMVEYIKTIL